MTPKLLRTFLAIIETGSVNRAAARLHLTQPALSRQIKLLEEDLGVALFDRHGRGVTLTGEGQILRDHAASLLRHLEQVRLEIVSSARVPRGTLSIGLPAPLRMQFSGELIDTFQAECPLVKLQVFDSTPHHIRERILGGLLELGVISNIEIPHGLICTPLASEAILLAAPPDTDFDLETPVPIDSIVGLPLVQTSQHGAIRTMLERHFARREQQPHFNIEVDSTHLMIDLVARGKSYTILPYSALSGDIRAGRIRAAPIEGLTIGWVLARLAERQVSVPARRMMEVLNRVVCDQIDGGHWLTARLHRPQEAGGAP